MALTPRQARFVDEYMIDLNAKQAAIRSGYSVRSAEMQGSRLLSNDEVADEVERRRLKLSRKAAVSAERVVAEMAAIGFSRIHKVVKWRANVTAMVEDEDTGEQRFAVTNEVQIVNPEDMDDDTLAGIAEISQTDKGGLKVKLHDKMNALNGLAKHLGLFAAEKVELTGKDGRPIETSDISVLEALPRPKREALRLAILAAVNG